MNNQFEFTPVKINDQWRLCIGFEGAQFVSSLEMLSGIDANTIVTDSLQFGGELVTINDNVSIICFEYYFQIKLCIEQLNARVVLSKLAGCEL
jgi:hypothetical protein